MSSLQVQFQQLRLKQAFKIAHGATELRTVLRLHWKGAMGEAPFVPYYPDREEDVKLWLESLAWKGQPAPEEGPKVGRLALDMLYYDWLGKQRGQAIYQLFGLANPSGTKKSYRSVGLDDSIDVILDQISVHAGHFDQIKLKLGSGNLDFDEELVARTRECFPKLTLCADANCGWTVDETLRMLPRMDRLNYAFLEQPVSRDQGYDVWRELHAKRTSTQFPIYADESIQSVDDILRLSDWIQGVNVKILKAASLNQAQGMMRCARSFKKRVLLGCMVESSIGITAAAHLSSLADEVDLDGALYLADDDYQGVQFGEGGLVILPDGPGIGGQLSAQQPFS